MKTGIKQKLDDLGHDALKKMYDEEKTLTNVAKKFNTSLSTIWQYFIKHNIEYNKQITYDADHEFFGRDNEKSFYWAGFFGADVNINKDKPRIDLRLATKDREHLEKFKSNIKTNAPIYNMVRIDERPAFKTKIYYSSNISFTSKQCIADLAKFNVVPAKTHIYTIPDWIENHPLCHHFLRGLIDGDGWIKHQKVGLCGTYNCVTKAREIIANKCDINIEKIHLELFEKHVPRINIYEKPLRKIAVDYLYKDATVWLDRKYEEAKKYSEDGEYVDRKIYINLNNIDTSKKLSEIAQQENTSIATVRRRLDESGVKKIMHRYIYNNCFDNECEEKYYWLGFLFNHSSFYKEKFKINITFRIKEVVENLQKFTNYYNCDIFDTGKGYRLTIASQEIYEKLEQFRIDKKDIIIDELINSKFFNHFIRGVIDAKSSFDPSSKRLVTNTNIDNDEQFRKILIDIVKLDIKSKNKISLRKNNIILLRNYIYKFATIYIKEKYDHLANI